MVLTYPAVNSHYQKSVVEYPAAGFYYSNLSISKLLSEIFVQ